MLGCCWWDHLTPVQAFLYSHKQPLPQGERALILKTISFPPRSRWGLLASPQPRGIRGGRQGGGLHHRHQDLRSRLRHGSYPVRLHHLQNQPGENQGDHEEVWEAAHQPVPPAAQAEGSAVAAAAINLSPAARGVPELCFYQPGCSRSESYIARLFIRISLHEAFLLVELDE